MKNAKIVFHMEKWPSHFLKGIPQTGFEPAVSSLGGRRFIQLSYWGILCIIVDFLKFNALGNKCVECFSHRSDRLHCNRDDGKVVASKFVWKISIPSLAFDESNHFCPQGIRLTEFLGGERSIQLSYEDGYCIIIPQLPHKIKLNRKEKRCIL